MSLREVMLARRVIRRWVKLCRLKAAEDHTKAGEHLKLAMEDIAQGENLAGFYLQVAIAEWRAAEAKVRLLSSYEPGCFHGSYFPRAHSVNLIPPPSPHAGPRAQPVSPFQSTSQSLSLEQADFRRTNQKERNALLTKLRPSLEAIVKGVQVAGVACLVGVALLHLRSRQ